MPTIKLTVDEDTMAGLGGSGVSETAGAPQMELKSIQELSNEELDLGQLRDDARREFGPEEPEPVQ